MHERGDYDAFETTLEVMRWVGGWVDVTTTRGWAMHKYSCTGLHLQHRRQVQIRLLMPAAVAYPMACSCCQFSLENSVNSLRLHCSSPVLDLRHLGVVDDVCLHTHTCRVMVDHPGVGPNYAAYAAVDKEFADFMACRSTKGLAPPAKGNQ